MKLKLHLQLRFMKRIFSNDVPKYLQEDVKVSGWVNARRDHGKIIFIDLRDKEGIVQIVFTPEIGEFYNLSKELRDEWVIEVIGKVEKRPEKMKNPKIGTGDIELKAEELKIYSPAKTLPFSIESDGYEINEEKRLKYRYLDLRRKRLQKNLKIRQEVIYFMRTYLKERNFIEVETPILTKSTPEGARDFLVPARLQPGKFYALPQSPQQYKQLLMVAGLERYFQIARCLRDEDPRADRQAEHTQLDIEMSFVEQNDILDIIESLYIDICKKLFPEKRIMKIPFPRMTYKEAMTKYKSDKPDLRLRPSHHPNEKDPNELAFCFITDFPMFEWHKGEKTWGATHHPFTKPKVKEDKSSLEKIKKNPEKIISYQHDFVLNGSEIGGGSIRSTNLNILTAVFEVLGHSPQETKEQFKNYFEAFQYGVPPHGGIACGIDRFLSIILREPSIREVIAFPKTGDNRGLMMGTPSEVSESQLKELHIRVRKANEG
jgi:aspartyl-tRNA synthetase